MLIKDLLRVQAGFLGLYFQPFVSFKPESAPKPVHCVPNSPKMSVFSVLRPLMPILRPYPSLKSHLSLTHALLLYVHPTETIFTAFPFVFYYYYLLCVERGIRTPRGGPSVMLGSRTAFFRNFIKGKIKF